MIIRVVFILLFVSSCHLNFAQISMHTITIDSDNRTYYVYIPTGFNQQTESLPVIFVLHGLGSNASQMMLCGFNQIADTARIIIVYPEGKPNAFNQQAWSNGTALESNANDVKFINVLIDTLHYYYNINLSRVYVAGFSMGGIMAHRLGCRLSNRIAAIASMAGTISTYDLSNCTPTFPVPVIHWHGTSDNIVPYNSNQLPTLELVPATIHYWLLQNNCTPVDSVIVPIPDNAPNDGYTIDKIEYLNCPDTVKVELWKINNGPHTWFFQPLNDADGAKEFWKFFRQFQRNSLAYASFKENIDSIKITVIPNPSHDGWIQLNGNFQTIDAELFNLQGKLVLKTILHLNQKIYIQSKGMYILKIKANDNVFYKKVIIQ